MDELGLLRLLCSEKVDAQELNNAHRSFMDMIVAHFKWTNEQQCATEFLVFFIELISKMFNIFLVKTTTEKLCTSCNYVHGENQIVPLLSIHLPVINGLAINQLLMQYLDKHSNPSCSPCLLCKSNKFVVFREKFISYPKCLVIMLKRVIRESNGNYVKIRGTIKVERDLTLDQHHYSLTSAVIHEGGSSSSGHYVCVKNFHDLEMVRVSDSSIMLTGDFDNICDNCVVLIYEDTDLGLSKISRSKKKTLISCYHSESDVY